jgi:hypothetical protein
MKLTFAVLTVILTMNCFAQKNNTINKTHNDTASSVSFIVRFHINELDKDDAVYLKGYVVNIGHEQAKKLNGKKIRITGKVTIIKASKNRSPGQPIPQERQGDYKYIESPQIEIIKE